MKITYEPHAVPMRQFNWQVRSDAHKPGDAIGYGETKEQAIKIYLENQKYIDQSKREDYDPTPWCNYCGAKTSDKCDCGPLAEND